MLMIDWVAFLKRMSWRKQEHTAWERENWDHSQDSHCGEENNWDVFTMSRFNSMLRFYYGIEVLQGPWLEKSQGVSNQVQSCSWVYLTPSYRAGVMRLASMVNRQLLMICLTVSLALTAPRLLNVLKNKHIPQLHVSFVHICPAWRHDFNDC